MLHRCLRDHPQVSGFHDTGVPQDEGQYLQSIFSTDRQPGGHGPGKFGFHPQTFLNEKSPLATRENAEKLFREWGAHWNLEKPVLLEKSPPNLIRTRFLQALFPNAYFIVLMRHPAVVSIATQKWSQTSIASLLEHWLICHERFDLDKNHLQRVRIVKYEHFMTNPQGTMNELFDFIGLPPTGISQPIDPDINTGYFAQWQEYRDGVKDKIPDNFFDHMLESRLMRFNYSLLDLNQF